MKNILEIKIGDNVFRGDAPLNRGKTICLMQQIVSSLGEAGIAAEATAIPIKEKTVMVFVTSKEEFDPIFFSCAESKVESMLEALVKGSSFWFTYDEDTFSRYSIPELLRDFKSQFAMAAN